MYLYGCVSLLVPECAVCVCVCVISNQNTSKKPHYVSDLSKLDVLLHETYIKVLLELRYIGRSILSLGKIAHQMWRDHPFSQRNRTTERTVGVGLGGDRKVGGRGWTKFEKGGGSRQYREGFHKIGA